MKKSQYVDLPAIMNVIGAVYKKPKILEAEDKYHFIEEDFFNDFHIITFGVIYNLFQLGAKEITLNAINDYLESRPKQKAIYEANKGNEYLLKASENSNILTFDYYYNRMKKMTLLRSYQNLVGMDLSWLYDPNNIFDLKKKQEQEEWLDNTSLIEITNLINEKIESIKSEYVDNFYGTEVQIGQDIEEMINSFKKTPEIGYPLYGKFTNTITRGARLKKYYLVSAPTGVGKSRIIAANVAYIGCEAIYDLQAKKWISTGKGEPVLYIATEQDLSEVQTMLLSFLSAVDEEHILQGEYYEGEQERVLHAAELLKESKIYFEQLPDFSLKDIENTIIRNIREYDVKYCFLDYIHTSMKILEEISQRSGGVKLREDNILFMLSIRLKDICNLYNIFLMSATQLNSSYQNSETPDQNLLRGAKSIADKIDTGLIMLEVTQKDREMLESVVNQLGIEMPNIKISVYKNRRGKWKGVYLWCNANRGICRFDPIFVTNYNYEIIELEDLIIKIKDPQKEEIIDFHNS